MISLYVWYGTTQMNAHQLTRTQERKEKYASTNILNVKVVQKNIDMLKVGDMITVKTHIFTFSTNGRKGSQQEKRRSNTSDKICQRSVKKLNPNFDLLPFAAQVYFYETGHALHNNRRRQLCRIYTFRRYHWHMRYIKQISIATLEQNRSFLNIFKAYRFE